METQEKNNELINNIVTYWDNQPCNILNSIGAVGTREYFDKNSENRYYVEPHIKTFADFANCEEKRVLEIGCGIGSDGAEFAKHGADYVGIDISQNSLDIAKKRFEVYNLKGEFHKLSGDDKKCQQLGRFDLIYSFGVIHHYPNVQEIIDNVHTLLSENGVFKFMVYATHSWKNAMIKKGLDRYEAQDNCPLANTYTIEEIYTLLGNKYKNISVKQDHCFMFNIPAYKQRKYVLEPWFEVMPKEMRDAIKEYLGWHLLVSATKN